MTLDDLITKMYHNPKRIFNLPDQEVLSNSRFTALHELTTNIVNQNTYVVVDMDDQWTIPNAMSHSKCGWTPYAGMHVQGRVVRVVLRGKTAMLDGRVYALAGEGRNVCSASIASRARLAPIPLQEARTSLIPSAPSPTLQPPSSLVHSPSPPKRQPTPVASAQVPATAENRNASAASPRVPTSRAAVVGERSGSVKISQEIFAHAGTLPPRFTAKHVISVKQFTRDDLRYLFSVAHDMRYAQHQVRKHHPQMLTTGTRIVQDNGEKAGVMGLAQGQSVGQRVLRAFHPHVVFLPGGHASIGWNCDLSQ